MEQQQQRSCYSSYFSKEIEKQLILKKIELETNPIELYNMRNNQSEDFKYMQIMEKLYWYYEDHLMPKYESPSNIYSFCMKFAKHFKLNKYYMRCKIRNYIKSKCTIERCGCILLSKDKNYVAIVKSYFRDAWGFPCGKQYISETAQQCAIRECKEELGYDIEKEQISTHHHHFPCLKLKKGKFHKTLFLVTNVSLLYEFHTNNTHKEVGAWKWVRLTRLHEYLTRDSKGVIKFIQNNT